jgi:hypothetical protein
MRYLSVLCLLFVACKSPAPAPAAAPEAPAQPLTAMPMGEQPAAAPLVPKAGGMAWKVVAPLVARTPKSSMRAAEYGVEGDVQAELSVFYFGVGQGGTVDENIARWVGQLKQADGSDSATKAVREERKINGLTVTTVEAAGAYSGGMAMPGMASAGPIDQALLLGAIANGPNGQVFFKLVGPQTAVEKARVAFKTLVDSLHVD